MVLLAGEMVPSPTRPKEDTMTSTESHILVAEAPTWKTLPLTFADDQDADISITSWMFNDPQCDLATYLASEEEVDEVDEAIARTLIDMLTRAAARAPLSKEDYDLLEASNITLRTIKPHITPNTRLRYWHMYDGMQEETVAEYLKPDWHYIEAISNLADRKGVCVPYGLDNMLTVINIACEGQQDHSDLIHMIGGTTRVDILPS